MEEQQARRSVGEKDGGQSSRNNGETGPEPKEHRVDIVDEISPRVKNWFEDSVKKAEERTQSQTQWPRIPKVPQLLIRGTKDFEKFYEPRVISIGPYHHGKPHLDRVEMIKPLYARKFLACSNQDIEALYTKIESNIEAVRNCYDCSRNKYGDEALARMMLLDGCFILQLITEDRRDVLRDHEISFVVLDLFLLENQLPFGVLKLIFEGAKLKAGLPTMEEEINKFITSVTGRPEIKLKEEDKEPSHLFDPLRSALLGKPEQEQEADKEPSHLLDLLRSALLGKPDQEQEAEALVCKNGEPSSQGNRQSFRHIKELKAAGISLNQSTTGFLKDISFKSYFFFGYLNLPPIIIDDFTKPMFLNIIAYEMCPDFPNDYGVTSYMCFLDHLIDHADDVKELRSKHILYNRLGSDEEVAQIFNEISNDLVDPDAYKKVKVGIQKHYNKRVNTWVAQALHDYCSSPWTIIAFMAAVLVLLFTGVSAYYAIPGTSSYWGADLLRS